MENGWIVSIQNGTNNWAGATTSEVWAWSANGERNYPPDGPRGWQTDGEVTTFINEVAAFME